MDSNDSELYSMRGWLKKKAPGQNLWHKRFAILTPTVLILSKDEDQSNIEEQIPITAETRAETASTSGSPRFQLFSNTSTEEMLFGTQTFEELHKWVFAINHIQQPMPKLSMDDFRIVSVLGRGFYGKVMLCQKNDTGELYAIKSIHKNRLSDADKIKPIMAERNIMMKVKHPFIVHLCFAFQTPSKFYLGLEYAPGGELFYHMDQVGTIPIDDARLYIAEIGLALSHLHSLGIVYRDLKPENVLFDVEGHVKITDFGLSKSLAETGQTSTFCGTPDYLAPEVIMQQPYSYGIDEWALGVLSYEMILGQTPFYDDNKAVLFNKIVHEDPFFPEGLDDRIIDFLSRLLTKDPNERAKFTDLKTHPFFEGFDWDKVYNREYSPSFIPDVQDPEVPSNFDPEFTTELPADSFVQPGLGEVGKVQGFSYVDASLDEP